MKPSLIQIINPDNVPHYAELSDYAWVDTYLNFLAKKKELLPLKAKRKKIEETVISKEDFMAKLKEEYEAIKIRRAQYLAQWLIGQWTTTMPSNTMEMYNNLQQGVGLPVVPDWAELEKILEGLEFQDTISKRDRAKVFQKIDRQIEKIKKELSNLCPDKYKTNGRDMRIEFIMHWTDLQRDLCGACGPIGIELNQSSALEREAYHKLGLERYINLFGRFLPHTGVDISPGF